MQIRILLFGPQAALAGKRQVDVDLPGPTATCGQVRQSLAQVEPRLGDSLAASRFAVNGSYAADDAVVSCADEVALIGLVSGG